MPNFFNKSTLDCIVGSSVNTGQASLKGFPLPVLGCSLS